MPNATCPQSRRKSLPGPETLVPKLDASELDPRRWLALAVVLGATFLGVLDFFIVNVSIPSIHKNLPATLSQIELMIAGYGLTYAVCLITGGRLGDIYGRKRMFMYGVGGFTLASVLCGVAPGPNTLIAARLLQGVTGALMFPQVLSIIQVTFPPAERHAAFGILGMVLGAGSFMANVLGGFLIEGNMLGLGWRPIFLVNLPLGAVALTIAPRVLRESRSATAQKLDLGGIPLISLALFLLVYPLAEGRDLGWPPWAFACLAGFVPALAVFILYERSVSAGGGSPLVELTLFRDRVFVVGLVTTLLFYSGLSAFFMTVTFFLQEGMKLSPKMAGYTLVPFGIGFLVASSLAVKLARRLGSLTINIGAAMMIVGLIGIVMVSRWRGSAVSTWELVPLLLMYGTGQGFVMPTLISTVLSGIPSNAAGSASGVLTTTQQVAMATGVAFIGTIFFAILGGKPRPEQFAAAISSSLLVNIVLLTATFALAFLLPRTLNEEIAERHVEI